MPHFADALTILRDRATDLSGMGRSFERLMQSALRGIPEAAHHYVVNGRTPREWAVDRLAYPPRPGKRHRQCPTPGSPTARRN